MDSVESRLWSEYQSSRSIVQRNVLAGRYAYIATIVAEWHHRKYRHPDLADIKQEAQIILLHAVERYQPDRHVPFAPWATLLIQRRLVSVYRAGAQVRQRLLKFIEHIDAAQGFGSNSVSQAPDLRDTLAACRWTPEERRIVRHLADGVTGRQICQLENIGLHRYRKLLVSARAKLQSVISLN